MTTQIWYHANCYDGFGAAWAAWRKFQERAIYVACAYGQPMPRHSPEDQIFIVDFSFPRAELLKLKDSVRSLIVLDHHITAARDLEGLSFAVFDMERSGAGITWDYLFPGQERPGLIDLIEDRDLWRFKKLGSEAMHAYLCAHPFSFKIWDNIEAAYSDNPIGILATGEMLLQQKKAEVKKICAHSWLSSIKGMKAAMVNTSLHWSEVGHDLLQIHPEAQIAASFTVYKDRVQWSLRSRGDIDVSALAKQFGGGGHKSAAGFYTKTLDNDMPFSVHSSISREP